MGEILIGLWTKIIGLTSSLGGLIKITITSLLAFFLPIKTLFVIIFVLVGIDMLLAMWINRNKLSSSKARETLFKLFIYIMLIGSIFSIEAQLGMAVLFKIVFSLVGLIEIYSIIANAIIICPNLPVLRLCKKLLSSEIAKKLEMTDKELSDIMDVKK